MEGDIFESFIPFTKKRSSRAFCSQSSISLSQRSSINSKQRNLLGFFKPKVDISSTFVETQNEFLKPNEPERCKNAVSKVPKDSTKPTMENEKGYCPTCQVPLSSLGVQPDVHAFSCTVSWTTLEECSFGEACNETNIFHFRDYAHSKLAQLRATTSCQTPTSRKRRISVSNSESNSTNSNILLDSPVRNYQSSSKLRVKKKFTSSSSDSVICSSKVKDLYDQLVINDNCVDNISPEIEPVTVNERTKIITNPISEKELIISPERVSKSLNFKGNVIYKDKIERSFSSRKCVRADTISCEECLCNMIGQAPIETEEIETCVEMTLSPPSNKTIQSPIKVQLMYNQLGWQSMGLDAKPEADVEEVAVKVCSCSHCIEMECTVADTNSNTSVACQRNRCTSDLQSKVFVNLEDLGITKNTSKSVPTLRNKHMCITSTLNPNGSSSMKLEVSSGNTKLVEGSNPSVSNMGTVSVPSVDTAVLEEEVSTADKMYVKTCADAAAKKKWKELLVGMKSKGFNSMSVLSDDSISATAHQYGDMAVRDKNTKQCPFYKRIPDTSFVVDAFQYGIIPRITHYFLSHFHADHYGGLKKSFNKPIICSAITARLVKKKLGVDSCYLNVIELDRPLSIRQVTVTALDANHCPGSVMFLFQLLDGRNFLHVGDFRADPDMESYPCFWNLNIDKVFLDTTYCNPRYTFPTQAETIVKVVEITKNHLLKNPATVIISGTYTIGKEKVFMGIADALNLKVWAKKDKRRVLDCLEDPSLKKRLVDFPWEAQVHVWPMMDLRVESLKLHVKQCKGRFKQVLAFKPSGWELQRNGDPDDYQHYTKDNITIYSVPYSEHSSFTEMRRFVQFLKPAEIIPTVNMGSSTSRATMQRYFKQWLSEPQKLPRSNKTQHKLTSFLTSSNQK